MCAGSRSIESILSEHEFFKDLKPKFLEVVNRSASFATFKTHDYLFCQGKPSSRFFLLLEGSVGIQVYAGEAGSVDIEELGAGSIVGWTWLLPPYEWVFSGEALERTNVIAFDGVRVRDACEGNSEFGYEMARRLTQIVTDRLTKTRSQLLNYIK